MRKKIIVWLIEKFLSGYHLRANPKRKPVFERLPEPEPNTVQPSEPCLHPIPDLQSRDRRISVKGSPEKGISFAEAVKAAMFKKG